MLYGAAWMQSALASRLAEDADDDDPRKELRAYLESPLEPFRTLSDSGVIVWWRDHSVIYPTVSKMARDYLAIPASSTASERQFSSGRHIGTDFRNRLSPEMFEAVQVLKGGYKAGVISAHLEIAALAKELGCTAEDMGADADGPSL
jgi:hypothetical protein